MRMLTYEKRIIIKIFTNVFVFFSEHIHASILYTMLICIKVNEFFIRDSFFFMLILWVLFDFWFLENKNEWKEEKKQWILEWSEFEWNEEVRRHERATRSRTKKEQNTVKPFVLSPFLYFQVGYCIYLAHPFHWWFTIEVIISTASNYY